MKRWGKKQFEKNVETSNSRSHRGGTSRSGFHHALVCSRRTFAQPEAAGAGATGSRAAQSASRDFQQELACTEPVSRFYAGDGNQPTAAVIVVATRPLRVCNYRSSASACRESNVDNWRRLLVESGVMANKKERERERKTVAIYNEQLCSVINRLPISSRILLHVSNVVKGEGRGYAFVYGAKTVIRGRAYFSMRMDDSEYLRLKSILI